MSEMASTVSLKPGITGTRTTTGTPLFATSLKLREDLLVGAPGLGPVGPRVDVLDVEVEEVDVGEEPQQAFGVCPARRCPRRYGMPASWQRSRSAMAKSACSRTSPPGQGDASARIAIEVGIALDQREHLVCRHLLACDPQASWGQASTQSPHTVAGVAIDDDAVGADGDGPDRAGGHAPEAPLAEGVRGASAQARGSGTPGWSTTRS